MKIAQASLPAAQDQTLSRSTNKQHDSITYVVDKCSNVCQIPYESDAVLRTLRGIPRASDKINAVTNVFCYTTAKLAKNAIDEYCNACRIAHKHNEMPGSINRI
jgi:hypothetical protein